MCLNDGAPVEPALCDQEAMPAADGKAKSFIFQIGVPQGGIPLRGNYWGNSERKNLTSPLQFQHSHNRKTKRILLPNQI